MMESRSLRLNCPAGDGLLPLAGFPVIEHAEDVSLAAGAVMREGVPPRDWAWPACRGGGVCMRGRDVQLAELTGARVHIAHFIRQGVLEQVRSAKQRVLRVSCEVTPHHFTLIDEDCNTIRGTK